MAPNTRPPRAHVALISFSLVSTLAAGCRVPPPTLQQVLQLGYLTPEQAYESWRTAIQGNLLVEEYRCLSKGWRRRNGDGVGGVSLFAYSEVRDAHLEAEPLLRLALKRADPPRLIAQSPAEVIFQARIPGALWYADHWLLVRLVREGFTAVHTIDRPDQAMHGERAVDLLRTGALSATSDGEETTLEARVQVPSVTDDGTEWPRDVVLMQVGWEWKVDDFDVLPEPVAPHPSAAVE
jgi:hypothetical protein